jgi:hypothetical protein
MIPTQTPVVHLGPVYPIASADEIFQALRHEFGITVAARHIVPRSDGFDSLEVSLYDSWAGKNVFLNLIDSDCPAHWLARAHTSAQLQKSLVVVLAPRRFESAWWSVFSAKATEVRFPRGRLAHGVHQNGSSLEIAILIFRPRS